MAWIRCCYGCGVGRQLQLRFTPSRGTSIGCTCSPGEKKEKIFLDVYVLTFSLLIEHKTVRWTCFLVSEEKTSSPVIYHCITNYPQAFFFFFFFFCLLLLLLLLFLGPLPRHMEVPRLGVELELQPPAYARATATRDPSRVCNLHHSSRQRRIVNPLSKGRDRTLNLMVPSRIR